MTEKKVEKLIWQESDYLSPYRIVLILAVFVFISETIIMVLISFPPSRPRLLVGLNDSLLLVVMLSPAFYFFLLKPILLDNAKNRSILESIPEMLFILNSDGVFTGFKAMKGMETLMPPEDFIGKKASNVLPTKLAEETLKHIELALRTETAQLFEYELPLKGILHNYEAKIARISMDKVLCIVRDITERKRAEEVLRESEYFFRESQRAAFIGSYKTDFTTGFWESSEVLDRIFGIDRNYSRSVQGWIEIVHPDDREMMDRYLREEIISKRKPFNKEYRIIRKSDGQIRWVNGLGEVDFDTEGKIISMIGTIQDITEKKELEEALKESEERFRTLFEGAPDAIFLADSETGIIIDANSKASELTALPYEEIIGMHRARLHPPRIEEYSIDTFKKHALKKKQKKEINLFENFVLRPDGTEVPVEVLAQIVNINGRPILQGVFRDITERKLTEDKLRKSEESFSKAGKIGHFGYWEWEVTTNKLVWSDEVFQLYGLDPQKVVPTYETVVSTLSDETRVWFNKAIDDALNNNAPFEGEYSIIRPDGSLRHTHTIGEVIRDRNGKPLSMFGVVQDITERKKAEDELLKFKLGIERSDEVIFITNIDGSIIYINPAFEKIYGYSREEALGKTPRIIKSGLLPSEAYKTFWDTLLEKKVVNGELINKTKDGRLLNIDGSANPILNDGGNIVGFLAIQCDITERKLAEEHIKKSLKEKEVLLREIHHRVKNNMQIVSSLLMLQSRNIEDKKYRDMFIDSQNRILSMALIHEKLYQSENLAQINFKEYINEIASNIFSSYGLTSNIKIDINIENITINIDNAVPCGLIINELVTNSLKYAFPEGRKGKIQISVKSKENNMIQLSISDDGIGIPKDMDIRNTTSLGLTLITALAENQLNGELIINREKGTEFQINFRGT